MSSKIVNRVLLSNDDGMIWLSITGHLIKRVK